MSTKPDLLALDALKAAKSWLSGWGSAEPYLTQISQAIAALEAAQSLPAQAMPVCWIRRGAKTVMHNVTFDKPDSGPWDAAYLAHPVGVPAGWKLVPIEPTEEIIAAAAIAVWPTASEADIEMARKAAPIVLMKADLGPGFTVESLAASIATMAPAYRAIIAAAPSLPVDEKVQTLTETLQQQCSDWGVYWRAPDAHGVKLTTEQAAELLRHALNVEVEVEDERLEQARYDRHSLRNIMQILCFTGMDGLPEAWVKYYPDDPVPSYTKPKSSSPAVEVELPVVAWAIYFQDERDFCLSASPLIGAAVSSGKSAVERLNTSAWGHVKSYGNISSTGPASDAQAAIAAAKGAA